MNLRRLIAVLLLVILCVPSLALAARGHRSAANDSWTFSVAPYMWLNKYHTTIGGTDVSDPLSDLTTGTNSSFVFVASAHWKKWAFAFDGVFNDLDETVSNSEIQATMDVKQTILQPHVGYAVLDNQNRAADSGQTLWVNLGARYWDNQTYISWNYLTSGSSPGPLSGVLNQDDSWWDALVGVSAHFQFDDKVHGYVRGNVGGFGLSDSSDFTWDLAFVFSYHLSRVIGFQGGYQLISFDRTTGEGPSESTTEQLTEGLFVGASVVF